MYKNTTQETRKEDIIQDVPGILLPTTRNWGSIARSRTKPNSAPNQYNAEEQSTVIINACFRRRLSEPHNTDQTQGRNSCQVPLQCIVLDGAMGR